MHDLAREKLCHILATQGRKVLEDPRRLRGLLRDYCPDQKREVHVLLAALEEQIPQKLEQTPTSVPWAVVAGRLADTLTKERALNADASRWAVETWGLALKRVDAATLAAEKKATPAPSPAKKKNVQSTSSQARLPGGYYPCPDCGFVSIRDGMTCPRCGYVSGAAAQKKPVQTSPTTTKGGCPKCGFAYGWNGKDCSHCGYPSTTRSPYPTSAQAYASPTTTPAPAMPTQPEPIPWPIVGIICPIGGAISGVFVGAFYGAIVGAILWLVDYWWGWTLGIQLTWISVPALLGAMVGAFLAAIKEQQESRFFAGVGGAVVGAIIGSLLGKWGWMEWSVEPAVGIATPSLVEWAISATPASFWGKVVYCGVVFMFLCGIGGGIGGSIGWPPGLSRVDRESAAMNMGVLVIAGALILWRLYYLDPNEVHKFETPEPAIATAISPDGKAVMAVHRSGEVIVWDVDTRSLPDPKKMEGAPLSCAAFADEGRAVLASDSSGFSVRYSDILKGGELARFDTGAQPLACIAVSPLRKYAVGGSQDGVLRRLHLQPGQTHLAFQAHDGPVTAIALTPDGKTILSGGADGTVRAWKADASEKVEIHVFRGHAGNVMCLAVSADGRQVASADVNKTLRIWDIATGSEFRVLDKMDNAATCAAFVAVADRAEGNVILFGSGNTLTLWDPVDKRTLRTFSGHTAKVTSLSVFPDNTRFVSGSEDKTVRLWKLPDLKNYFRPTKPRTADLANQPVAPLTNGLIAFNSDRDGNQEIYVMNADGSGQTRLTNNMAADYGPAWSPDGSKIAFHSNQDVIYKIYVMNADGSEQAWLTMAENHHPAWSPDGSKIVFSSDRDGNREIYVMNADGSEQTRLTNNTALDGFPSWQPVRSGSARTTVKTK